MATEQFEWNDEDDLCNLLNPTRANVVSNLKKRFERKKIYVSTISYILLIIHKTYTANE